MGGGVSVELSVLLMALIAVESGGNDAAIGDGGGALGCLQIRHMVIADVNMIYGTNYQHGDALSRTAALEIAELYLRHYGGENGTAEEYARIWNGGPRGPFRTCTLPYWMKVRAELERIEG